MCLIKKIKWKGSFTESLKAQEGTSKCEMMPGKRPRDYVMRKSIFVYTNTLKHFKTKHREVNKITHDLMCQMFYGCI